MKNNVNIKMSSSNHIYSKFLQLNQRFSRKKDPCVEYLYLARKILFLQFSLLTSAWTFVFLAQCVTQSTEITINFSKQITSGALGCTSFGEVKIKLLRFETLAEVGEVHINNVVTKVIQI